MSATKTIVFFLVAVEMQRLYSTEGAYWTEQLNLIMIHTI